MKKSRSLAQMRAEAQANNGQDAWACPKCGCPGPHRVENTYDTAGGKRRRRICRNCGQGLIATTEVPVPKGFRVIVVPKDNERDAA